MNMKLGNLWVDGNTPPEGYHISQKNRKPFLNMNFVSDIQAHINEFSTIGGANIAHMAPLLPASSGTQYPVPSIVNNNPLISGQSFEMSIYLTCPSPIDASVTSVSINGRAYYGPAFESTSNLLNWLLNQIEFTYLMLGWHILNCVYLSIPLINRGKGAATYAFWSMF